MGHQLQVQTFHLKWHETCAYVITAVSLEHFCRNIQHEGQLMKKVPVTEFDDTNTYPRIHYSHNPGEGRDIKKREFPNILLFKSGPIYHKGTGKAQSV
jgi:hypothetical protein